MSVLIQRAHARVRPYGFWVSRASSDERIPVRHFPNIVAVVLCGLALSASAPFLRAGEFSQTLHYRVRLFSGGTLTMDVRTGDIQIRGWDDPHVRIEAEKSISARSKKAAQRKFKRIKILLDGQDEQVRLGTLYPPRRIWRPFRGESELTVNFSIWMPYDANLILKCVDGDIWVRGLAGNEQIMDNYGQVEIGVPSVSGIKSLNAKTWLGNIQSDLRGENSAGFVREVSFSNPDGKQEIRIKVHMGGIYIFSGGADGAY